MASWWASYTRQYLDMAKHSTVSIHVSNIDPKNYLLRLKQDRSIH